jgi:hypothetical protein
MFLCRFCATADGRLGDRAGCAESLTATCSVIALTSPHAHDLHGNRSPAHPTLRSCTAWRIAAASRLDERTIDRARYPPGRRYPALCALRMASTPSSTLSSGVVLNAFTAPPA